MMLFVNVFFETFSLRPTCFPFSRHMYTQNSVVLVSARAMHPSIGWFRSLVFVDGRAVPLAGYVQKSKANLVAHIQWTTSAYCGTHASNCNDRHISTRPRVQATQAQATIRTKTSTHYMYVAGGMKTNPLSFFLYCLLHVLVGMEHHDGGRASDARRAPKRRVCDRV